MAGLVLEGGAFRGLFTAGVLDGLLDIGTDIKYIIGVSAGATNAYSYVSKQRGRNLEIMEKFLHNKRYIGYRNLLKCRSIMDLDFSFDEIPNKYCVFDYDTFYKNEAKMLVGAFNIESGEVDYFDKDALDEKNSILRASCAIPFAFPFCNINGHLYADGGLKDSIPIKKSIADGNEKNIIVLTRNEGYIKKKSRTNEFAYRFYKKKYPKLAEALKNRYIEYNKQVDYCNELEKSGKALIIRPEVKMDISRFEKDKEKLRTIYRDGYDIVIKNKNKILDFIK